MESAVFFRKGELAEFDNKEGKFLSPGLVPSEKPRAFNFTMKIKTKSKQSFTAFMVVPNIYRTILLGTCFYRTAKIDLLLCQDKLKVLKVYHFILIPFR